MIYLETSVLVAYYCPEPLSRRAERLIRVHSRPAVCDLTEVELRSALSRKVRLGELQATSATQIASRFSSHLEEGLYTRVPLQRRHYEMAIEWLGRLTLALRTLDALHLAVAASEGFRLATADAALARSAKALGIDTHWLRPKARSRPRGHRPDRRRSERRSEAVS
ncbi:MAG: type II toxin-antitoxin system VapC family toxin [Thermoanaerobaculia bacterium]